MRRALRKRHVFDFVPSYLNSHTLDTLLTTGLSAELNLFTVIAAMLWIWTLKTAWVRGFLLGGLMPSQRKFDWSPMTPTSLWYKRRLGSLEKIFFFQRTNEPINMHQFLFLEKRWTNFGLSDFQSWHLACPRKTKSIFFNFLGEVHCMCQPYKPYKERSWNFLPVKLEGQLLKIARFGLQVFSRKNV